MAIFTYFGKTESGKSYLANIHSKKYKRVVIYDNAHCFNDGEIITDLNISSLKILLLKTMKRKSFRLIFRAPSSMSEQKGANRIASFVFQLGTFYKENVGSNMERFLFLVDEAHIVSSMSKESSFYRAVTKGRHFCFDCFGISQGVMKLPNYWRENQKQMFLFKLPVSEEIKKSIGREACDELGTLDEYSYIKWSDNEHSVSIFDKNGKALKSIDIN